MKVPDGTGSSMNSAVLINAGRRQMEMSRGTYGASTNQLQNTAPRQYSSQGDKLLDTFLTLSDSDRSDFMRSLFPADKKRLEHSLLSPIPET